MDVVDRVQREWANENPELNTLPMSVIDRLLRITKRVERLMMGFYQQVGLTAGEFEVLMTLRRVGAPYCLTPSDLQASLLLSSGAMTNRLNRLEQKGLLTRGMSIYDRRNVEVTLTEKGVCRVEVLLLEYVALQEQLLSGFSVEEQESLSNQLRVWLRHYEKSWHDIWPF
ncbi:MarR family winged helix-turn-helix transcriptional regulator [Vibrio metoecus]|uniref:MarR family winged helix-turn-helix transcriptional regulator n=1 Tax=Vibrio metoecus TaxID=1481663 RepID=UPI0006D7C202|nr:MarR family transcriptional regulator [Vibrio metoecus]KQA20717.1 MarR family transcriptional regulator [Vibrio metoecus]